MNLYLLAVSLTCLSACSAQELSRDVQRSVATGLDATTGSIVNANQSPKVHEIHTNSEREVIRVEEYKRPRQIIRIHEAPAPPPEIIRVQAPPEPQKVIRVVQRARPTQVQFTDTQPAVQVVSIPIQQVRQVVKPVVQETATVQAVQPVSNVAYSVEASPNQIASTSLVQQQAVYSAPTQTTGTTSYQTFSAHPVNTPSIRYSSAPSSLNYAVAQPQITQQASSSNYGSYGAVGGQNYALFQKKAAA